jgi:hypothetical protein
MQLPAILNLVIYSLILAYWVTIFLLIIKLFKIIKEDED